MNKEEKDLLLKDLCARLPYGVKALVIEEGKYKYKRGIIESIGTQFVPVVTPHDDVLLHFYDKNNILGNPKTDVICFSTDEIQPFLRPMSSMTEEEKEELRLEHEKDERLFLECINKSKQGDNSMRGKVITHFASDWCNKNHFDYRGLIEKGLALEAPEGMY